MGSGLGPGRSAGKEGSPAWQPKEVVNAAQL